MSSNNSTREIPISETLENLLTDVEFEYSDVTLEESTTTSTVPAESNLTADSETTEEPRGLPDHEFIRKTINGKKRQNERCGSHCLHSHHRPPLIQEQQKL